ncbi:MAG: 2Fe-2S iron-sulfur cluster binding domain-containing protein [Betaproteobacteria bacterium]|nr:2Fe-2S iron-sulfur cluster binding domain-containing protein [Betaproteobacteria bacterium]
MSRAYSDIAFTPTVRAMQSRMGSRRNYAALDHTEDRRDQLGAQEIAFIEERDGFYQATVSETGWPYVQFRGGPAGFLKVLDSKTLGYADFRGNVQYISTGNLQTNDRISIILMDYARQVRLKLLGRVRLVELDAEPALIKRLELPTYRARVERGVIIQIEGYDWNCPQHITPRFTEAEIEAASAPLRAELAELRARLAAQPDAAERDSTMELGKGPLSLRVTGIRQLAAHVRAYELESAGGAPLPSVDAGAHIDVPVRLASARGTTTPIMSTRRFSITRATDQTYEIAVQLEAEGTGGSQAVHRDYQLGALLHCGLPGNDFKLTPDAPAALLIAGGIGITPIRAMADALTRRAVPFQLHYAARNRSAAPYLPELQSTLGGQFHFHDGATGSRMDLAAILRDAPAESHIYICGPARLIEAARQAAAALGIAPARVHWEAFKVAPTNADRPVTLHLARSRRVIQVASQQSLLDAIESAGIEAPAACRTGRCGTCAVKVLAGAPEHRDHVLSAQERTQAALMCPCVSRAAGDALTLDL